MQHRPSRVPPTSFVSILFRESLSFAVVTLFIFSISARALALTETVPPDHAWEPVKRDSTLAALSVTGKVVPQEGALSVEGARLAGRVLSILKREGEQINKGTPLYEISSAECFSLNEERRIASTKHLQDLGDGVEKRERQLGLKFSGEKCFVVADHSGILTKRSLESGASFNAGDTLATILDMQRMTVELDVPERDQTRVAAGQKVKFQFASHPGKTFEGQIDTIVPTIDPMARTSKARLSRVTLPTGTSLEALVFGDVSLDLAQVSLRVPNSALVFSRNQQYVIRKAAKTSAIAVSVLAEGTGTSSIQPAQTDALREGDLVATRGAIFLFKQLRSENVP